MKDILSKLNFKGHLRIALINAEPGFIRVFSNELKNVIIDIEIDQRCPYSFIMIFVLNESEVKLTAPGAIHNLTSDGILWFCYPKRTSKKYTSDLEKDKGWSTLKDLGFHCTRTVSLNDDWSAMGFRNKKLIKSASMKGS